MKNYIYNKIYNGWHTVYNICGLKLKKKEYKPQHFDIVNAEFDSVNGLGNRILGLVNCINYYSPKVLNIYWDNKGWVSASFSDLFDTNFDFELNEYSENSILKEWQNDKHERTIVSPPCFLVTKDKKDLSLKYNDIEEKDREEFRGIFSKISPSKKVAERLDGLDINSEYVAVQVRNFNDFEKLGRNTDINLYFAEMDKYPQDTKFYLSAMSEEIADKFKQKYGEQIITLPNKNYNSMIDAVAELYMLGKATKAIYSPLSTFSELAWWLCGAKQDVTIVKKEDNNE